MSIRRGIYYILFVDVVVNAVNYTLIRLRLAGDFEATLIAAPAIYVVLLAVGFKVRGVGLRQEYGRNLRDSLTLSWGYFGISLFTSVVAGAIILAFIVGASGLGTLLRYEYPSNPVQTQTLAQTVVLAAFSLVVVGPSEETIFRGVAYGSLLDSSEWTGWRKLNLVQALGFGFAHLYYFYLLGPLGAVALVEIVGMGYGLGWAYYRCGGGLSGPILVHGIWDASSFLLLYPATLYAGGLLKAAFFLLTIYSVVKIASRRRPPKTHQNPIAAQQPTNVLIHLGLRPPHPSREHIA